MARGACILLSSIQSLLKSSRLPYLTLTNHQRNLTNSLIKDWKQATLSSLPVKMNAQPSCLRKPSSGSPTWDRDKSGTLSTDKVLPLSVSMAGMMLAKHGRNLPLIRRLLRGSL